MVYNLPSAPEPHLPFINSRSDLFMDTLELSFNIFKGEDPLEKPLYIFFLLERHHMLNVEK